MSRKNKGSAFKYWRRTRYNAQKRNISFTLKPSDIIIPEYCPVLGIEIRRGHQNQDHWPSIDRINNKWGYNPKNIVIISKRANRLKNDATLEELRMITDFYENLYSKRKVTVNLRSMANRDD